MKKLRWGILSTADIGLKQVIPAMQQGKHCEIVGIASRDLGRAREAAARLGIPKAFGSYEELLADASIDAVYNPLPNHLHVPWSIKVLEAGGMPVATIEVEGAAIRLEQGWYFPEFGVRFENALIVLSCEGRLPLQLKYRIRKN